MTEQILKKKKKTTGVYEWCDSPINFQYGCKYGCIYCYAYSMAKRYKRCDSRETWTKNIKLNNSKIVQNYRKRKGRIMFPTTHDIYPENVEIFIHILTKVLNAKNEVLITTKPDLTTIKKICDTFSKDKYKKLIQFRFTITSDHDEILKLWEPNAPDSCTRFASLIYAYDSGFKTSVSIEPYLQKDPQTIISFIEPYITETIWLGIMNKRMLFTNGKKLFEPLEKYHTKEHLLKIIPECKKLSNGKLRLKDSVRKLLKIY